MDQVGRSFIVKTLKEIEVGNEAYTSSQANKDARKLEKLIVVLDGRELKVGKKTYKISLTIPEPTISKTTELAQLQGKAKMGRALSQIRSNCKKSVNPKYIDDSSSFCRMFLIPRIEETSRHQISDEDRKKVGKFILDKFEGVKVNSIDDDLFVNLYCLVHRSEVKKLLDRLMDLQTLDPLEKYRGKKSGKYASDLQIKKCPKGVDLSWYADYSCPETGAPRTEAARKFMDDWFERKGEWQFNFLEDGRYISRPAGLGGREFYAPSKPADIELIVAHGFIKPQNWIYPGIIHHKREFSIVIKKMGEVLDAVFSTPKYTLRKPL